MGNLFAQQDIQGFFQNAINKDFARTNLFRVINITSPVVVFDESDLIYVTSANLPSRDITNVRVPFMGLNFNVPGTANYPGSEGWKVKFRMGQDLAIRQKLEVWSRSLFDDATSTGLYGTANLGNIVLGLFDKTGTNVIAQYNLIGAYCQSIGTFALDTTAAGAIIETDVTIAYQYWTSTLAV